MAPRKKTEEKPSANEAVDMVLRYIRKQNRPYSAIDVSANLHNKVTKAAAAKILKDLHEQKQIEGRAAGKQIVYHAIQDSSNAISSEQLTALDSTITSLRNQTVQLTATAKILRSTLSSLNSELSTADLITNVSALEVEEAEILGRLESLKAGKARKVTKEMREEVEQEWKKCKMLARRREKVARDVWCWIEDMPSMQEREKREELREILGLDE